jgi:hypothetical protein
MVTSQKPIYRRGRKERKIPNFKSQINPNYQISKFETLELGDYLIFGA